MGSLADELINRAKRAYYLNAKKQGDFDPEVPGKDSGIRSLGGLEYVVLRGPTDIYAVYRIRKNGALKRIKRRIPAGLEKL